MIKSIVNTNDPGTLYSLLRSKTVDPCPLCPTHRSSKCEDITRRTRGTIFLIPILSFVLAFTFGVTCIAAQDSQKLSEQDQEFFEKQVRPILVKRCFECHGGSEAEGGLSLASRQGWMMGGESGPAIIPGAPQSSLLIDAINHQSLVMPPAARGGKIPQAEIDVLKTWIERGAPDPRTGRELIGGMTVEEAKSWWAFQPIPTIPDQEFAKDVRHIDQLLLDKAQEHGLQPSEPADRRTLLRRLSYGLTGLPPSGEQMRAWEQNSSANAMSEVIERFMASPQYGVHWGRHWLDLVRYADTAGENADHPLPHAWRYRNWVIDSIQNNRSYQEFVRLQIAGDLIRESASPEDFSEGIVATGYLAIARRFGHDSDKDMYLTYEDVIDNIGKSYLGLTISCARCHDHKYDPISAQDYYALYGIFESSKFSFPGCEAKGQPRDLIPMFPQSQIDAILAPWQQKVAAIELEKQHRAKDAEPHQIRITDALAKSSTILAESLIAEGTAQPFKAKVKVRVGETIMLVVKPNSNHGADSTLVDWKIQEVSESERRSWSTSDLIDSLTSSNPLVINGATWSLVELGDKYPSFLRDLADEINGIRELKKWSTGDTPSVFANTSEMKIDVWTSLAPRSLFVHPGTNSAIGLMWTSPIDGDIEIDGRVADAHPAALDGVTFELSHVATKESGDELLALAKLSTKLPDAGPAPSIPVAFGVVDARPVSTRLHERGDPEKLGPEVPRRWLSVFGGSNLNDSTRSGRQELADWISESPLAARVMVNRIWEWHFGTGLVRSSSDFGTRGEKPSHPELLDFLASRFIQSGYSIKSMHRLILHTDAYQRASQPPRQTDPENRWLAHFNRRRLTAEEIRDSLLMVSGSLDIDPGTSHPFPAESNWRFTQHQPFSAIYDTNKRSAFLMVQRQRRHPFLALFDGSDPNASTANRQTTTVPTQALYFINDAFFHAQASKVAELTIVLPNSHNRVDSIYERLFQRLPTPREMDRSLRFADTYPGTELDKWSALARVLMASNEFMYVD